MSAAEKQRKEVPRPRAAVLFHLPGSAEIQPAAPATAGGRGAPRAGSTLPPRHLKGSSELCLVCLEWFILVSFTGMRVRGKPVNQTANTNYFSSFLKACPINKTLMLMCSSYLRPLGWGGLEGATFIDSV